MGGARSKVAGKTTWRGVVIGTALVVAFGLIPTLVWVIRLV